MSHSLFNPEPLSDAEFERVLDRWVRGDAVNVNLARALVELQMYRDQAVKS